MSNLDFYMDKKVSELVEDSPSTISTMPEEKKERQYIYSLLLMSMVAYCWNPNKRGIPSTLKLPLPAEYNNNLNPIIPLIDNKKVYRGKFLSNDYLGHNIAALAVDRDGYIIDFDFYHNEIFNSSIEHAEARLLHRLFSLDQIYESWNIGGDTNGSSNSYGKLLEGVTLYTSLESCAQCSGIMTLGNVNEVVYLQEDPGQYKIGNILYRLTESKDRDKKALAPRPISAMKIGFRYYQKLSDAFSSYEKSQNNSSLTSFLCTETAFKIFLDAEAEFASLLASFKITKQSFEKLKEDNDLPPKVIPELENMINKQYSKEDMFINDLNAIICDDDIESLILKYAEVNLLFPDEKILIGKDNKSELSNKEVLIECLNFYRYFVEKGRRGTPH